MLIEESAPVSSRPAIDNLVMLMLPPSGMPPEMAAA
jgi:hypothetical protein